VITNRILPVQLDQFSAIDDEMGPNVYTTTAQYVVPVTLAAGNTSWALMLHPEGLTCDLFITHCWIEGIFEFIDKVLNSWPHGARHAYCCMLSNPQSQDIARLISSPSTSPFASALRSASYMLVVPNRYRSIYTRIWCCYEAYLAHAAQKLIVTASPPLRGFRMRIVLTISIILVGFGSGQIIYMCGRVMDDSFARRFEPYLVAVVSIWFLTYRFIRHWYMSIALRLLVLGFSFLCGIVSGFEWMNKQFPYCEQQDPLCAPLVAWSLGIYLTMTAASCEIDRLLGTAALCESAELRKGYMGRIRAADASQEKDRILILEEITSSGSEKSVDETISALIRMGISTKYLQSLVAQVGCLPNVSKWSRLFVFAWIGMWILYPLVYDRDGVYEWTYHRIVIVLPTSVMAFAWCVLFMRAPLDRKAFVANCLHLTAIALPFAAHGVINRVELSSKIALFICSMTIVAISATGPLRIARMPFIGPAFVRFIFGIQPCRREPVIVTNEALVEATVFGKPETQGGTCDRQVGGNFVTGASQSATSTVATHANFFLDFDQIVAYQEQLGAMF